MNKKLGGNSKRRPSRIITEAEHDQRERAAGLAGALNDLAAELGTPTEVPRARQLPLVPTAAAGEADPGIAAKRGPGRPPGSRNKATQDWAQHLLRVYGSPLQAMAEVAFRPTLTIARELGCDPLDALKVQAQLWRDLAPYMHSKMPVAVEIDAGDAVPIIFAVSEQMHVMMDARLRADGMGERMKVIDHDAMKSNTYQPPSGDDGRSDDGQ